MGFFDTVMSLLDENSDDAFEKKMNKALDSIEHTLGAGMDKAESGLKKVTDTGKKVVSVSEAVESANDKIISTVSETAKEKS